ncbi:MAG: DUF1573 domain-containing protein [Chitinophagaceae bacterium]|nr:DUF1573 domain-containing protein [Chitinophagaceae bacterium]
MKRVFTFAVTFVFSLALSAQTAVKQDKTVIPASTSMQVSKENTAAPMPDVIALKETEFNFGKIPQGKPVTHTFIFTNTGKIPLSLENVQASCGCTTPEWSKEPVAAGGTSKINVGYNAANEGQFTKFITVTYNGTQTKQIIIKGEVWKTPATSAPVNTAVDNLKNQ